MVNQLKLMSAKPAFKIDQKIHNMLVKSNCDNQYVFLLQHFFDRKRNCHLPRNYKTTVLTECKVWVSKRRET